MSDKEGHLIASLQFWNEEYTYITNTPIYTKSDCTN